MAQSGQGIFSPANFGAMMITGKLKILICNPPKVKRFD